VNTARLSVGRLLEVRADAGYRSAGDVDALFDTIDRELATLPPDTPHVAVVDWRRCPLMSPEAAQRIAVRIAAVNARTERSAALATKDASVAVLQFLRVIREAGLPDRKLFFDQAELIDWLREVLSPTETQRLRAFLSEGRG
jgi:hypothetical protein